MIVMMTTRQEPWASEVPDDGLTTIAMVETQPMGIRMASQVQVDKIDCHDVFVPVLNEVDSSYAIFHMTP